MKEETNYNNIFFLENPIPMLIFAEKDLKILAVNNAAIKNYGYSAEEFLNMTILDIRPAEDIPLLLQHLKQMDDEKWHKKIWRHKKKDKTIVYDEVTIVSIEYNGKQSRLLTAYDISDKIIVEKKLDEAQNKFNALVQKSLFGIYIIQEGKFIYVNDEFANIFGYSKDEIIGKKSLYDLLDKSYSEIKYGEIFERLSSNFEVKKYNFKAVKKDNSVINIELSTSITEYDGKIALMGTVMDVTEINKNAENLSYIYELEKLISKISTSFIYLNVDEIDEGINSALRDIGQFMEVDRSYIFRFSDDEKFMSNTHEWCAKNIEPQIDMLQNLSTADYSWTIEKFKRYDVIKVPDVFALPPEAENEKNILLAQDIKSLILVPMFYSGRIIGFIGFDSVVRYRDWNDYSENVLKMLGEILTNALMRKKAESELSKLYNAIWQIHDSVVITDKDGVIEYVNPAFEKLTGYTKDEVIGKTPNILKSGMHSNEFYKKLWNTITNGQPFAVEFINKKKNGEFYYQESNITPMRNKLGNITHFICIGRDITERKKSEELRTRLTAILEATSDFVSTADTNFNILYINNSGKLMVGIDESVDYTKMKISDFHPEWITKRIFEEGMPKALEKGYWVGETAIKTLKGEIIPTSQVIITHKKENGEVEYFSTIIRDISDIKRTQEELRTREELYRLLLENQTDYIVKYDLDGRLIYASNTYCELFGCDRSKILGQTFVHTIDPDFINIRNEELKKIFSPPYITTFEEKVTTRNGSRWLAWSFKAELNNKGEVCAIVGSGRDITDRKLYEINVKEINEQLKQKILDLEISQKEISKLLQEVTEKKNALEKLSKDLIYTEERERKRFSRELHDSLGQILANLKLNLDLVNVSANNKIGDFKTYLEASQDLVNEAMQEVKNLSYDLRPAVLDDFGLNAALRLLVTQFQKRSGININLNLASEDQRYDPIIETALYRITQECLTNIAKYANAKNAYVQFIERNDALALTISDDGIGFDVNKILDMNSNEMHFGLRNIRERVEFLGGKLYIESSIGHGTEISVEIELKK